MSDGVSAGCGFTLLFSTSLVLVQTSTALMFARSLCSSQPHNDNTFSRRTSHYDSCQPKFSARASPTWSQSWNLAALFWTRLSATSHLSSTLHIRLMTSSTTTLPNFPNTLRLVTRKHLTSSMRFSWEPRIQSHLYSQAR